MESADRTFLTSGEPDPDFNYRPLSEWRAWGGVGLVAG